MPSNHAGPSFTGNYYDIAGRQTNITINRPVNVHANILNQDPNAREAVTRELKNRLKPAYFDGDDRPECLENTRKDTLNSIYHGDWEKYYRDLVAGQYQKRGQLGCHMFFVRGRSHPMNALQTIAYSLAVYNQSIAGCLVDQLKDRGDLDPSNLKAKFDILLRELLYTAAIEVHEPILIVLDALNECGTPKSRWNLINVLRDRLPILPPNFRFIITSRPENDILAFNSPRSPNVQTFDLDNRIDENKIDVFTFIKYELEELRSSRALSVAEDWSWDKGLQRLASTAGGLFIWASTAIKFISEEKLDRFERFKSLVENRNAPNLNGLYATILKNAFEWNKKEKEAFVGVLSFILFSKLSLSDEDINGILGINTTPDVLIYLRSLVEERGIIESISLSPGGRFIASGSYDGSICLWNLETGELVKKSKLSLDIRSVAFSPVNEHLIAFGSGSLNDGKVGLVTSVMFSPSDGKYIASGSWDNTICIWNVNRQRLAVGPLTGHTDWVRAVAYSPDGTRFVSGSCDNTVRIWNPATGQLLSTFNGHLSHVNSVAYSFDGSRIVSGYLDNTIVVWNAQSGQIVCGPITGHDRDVTSVCFSPDGKRILSGSEDRTARVWDVITGKPLFPPLWGYMGFNSVCFFPGGRHFATGSRDRTIRIWSSGDIPNDTNWELRRDNWVVGENGELMMWIPDDLHRDLCGHRNISILNRSFYPKLHFGTE